MPKPSDYTPARRRTMQVVVWVILLGTVGLAEVVSRSARRGSRVELAPQSVVVDQVGVQLPASHWSPRARGDDLRVIVQAEESGVDAARAGERGRVLRVLTERLDAPMSPLQYLDANFAAGPSQNTQSGADTWDVSVVRIGKQPGELVTVRRVDLLSRDEAYDLFACAILPSLRAVVVRLHGSGRPTFGDHGMVASIAGSITVADEPGVAADAQPLTLPDRQIALTPPKGFVSVERRDPGRSDRRLMTDTSSLPKGKKGVDFERDWTTIEVTGCFAPSGKGIEQKQRDRMSAAMLTMLLARDGELWRGATISPEGDTVWRAEPARPPTPLEPAASRFPARAYLMTDTKGLGLLAIFRGGFEGGGFDADWQALRESVKFPDPPPLDLAALNRAGGEEANRLKSAGYEKLLADRVEQWWLWTGSGEHPHLGWSHVDFDIRALAGKCETRLRRPGGFISRLTGNFAWHDSDGRYQAELNHAESDGEEIRASTRQTSNLAGDQLSLAVHVGDTPAAIWKAPLPPNYIPGALLPLVMGKLEAKTPMIVRSEFFPGGDEAVGPAELLSVLIRPASPGAATRKADGETEPMRCLTAEVNGSGRISRWFFRKSGELECVEFAGGVRCVPSDQAAIGFDFGNEKRMTP